ncbi:MAG TPA: CBS domain-containing protein, partial [Candidatus Stackebrandtia faecavium]|nr:CBS domain-containing protein [Candidatus Stackebrandtia faecavium]
VKPDDPIDKAITAMTHGDYSQLAVVKDKKLTGVISERSITRAVAKGGITTVHDATEGVRHVEADVPVMDLIDEINVHGYVFVCDQGTPCGVVTTADIAAEFVTRHAPIVTIGDIELRVRNRVLEKIDRCEFEHVLDRWQRDDANAAPTLGRYSKLLKGELWDRLEWGMDKDYFLKMLDHVTHVRNELMHFVPDPPDREQIQQIERFADTLFNLT